MQSSKRNARSISYNRRHTDWNGRLHQHDLANDTFVWKEFKMAANHFHF